MLNMAKILVRGREGEGDRERENICVCIWRSLFDHDGRLWSEMCLRSLWVGQFSGGHGGWKLSAIVG